MQTIEVSLEQTPYNIYVKRGLINDVSSIISKIKKYNKIFIITDENVSKYYLDVIKKELDSSGFDTDYIVLKASESSKSLDTAKTIYEKMLSFNLTRSDLVFTLGGGVVGDVGGFCASTFLRGVDFIQFPTTLLAQVDSSVGGKVGINLKEGKNLVGSFYQPKAVIIDPDVLSTLSDKYFKDGMAEVIKYACIKDKNLYDNLVKFGGKDNVIRNIEYIIKTCVSIKRDVVLEDERDVGERMKLNFGHTLAHGIEARYNYSLYSHGQSVAIGMYEITLMSESKGITKKGTSEKIKALLNIYSLEYDINARNDKDVISAISFDKKNEGNTLNLILLEEIGKSFIKKESITFFK